ncbi:MAG TPA: ParB/RepB/Spo0J family partition protein [Polyangiaceae bacterium]|nr:ParB/RepB/Spo0J family partition protein [Polyangiaceae bacterium]
MNIKRGLGRGLDALMPAPRPPQPAAPAAGTPAAATTSAAADRPSYGDGNVFLCPLERIVPQKGQPRQHFDNAKLDELAQSIREHGLLEPLVVRRKPGSGGSTGNDQYELIAGERRWRASQRAGLKEVMVVVHDVSSQNAFELAIIENVQREDLDPIELAEALDRLVKEHGYTQEKLAERVGKDRSTIANSLRLLRLPEVVRTKVVMGELSEGHARALLGIDDAARMADLAEKIVRGRLSVRQTEELVRGAKGSKSGGGKSGGGKSSDGKSASVRDLEKRLERKLGTPCEVADKEGKGRITIQYSSLDELDRILDLIL